MGVEPGTALPLPPATSLRRLLPLVALVLLVVAGQAASVASAQARPLILGASVLLLDVLGVVYCWKAARCSVASATAWWVFGAGRAASVGASIGLTCAAVGGGVAAWWWIGTLARLLMYVLLASGVLIGATQFLRGRSRRALLTEGVTVLAAGFMLIWYLVLEPILAHQRPSYVWVSTIGVPLGDVLLIAAVSGDAVARRRDPFAAPVGILIAGLVCHLVSDVTWATIGLDGELAARRLSPP